MDPKLYTLYLSVELADAVVRARRAEEALAAVQKELDELKKAPKGEQASEVNDNGV